MTSPGTAPHPAGGGVDDVHAFLCQDTATPLRTDGKLTA